MKIRALVNASITATAAFERAAKCVLCNNCGLTITHQVNALPVAQGVRRSSRCNVVCGCRLASALAGTGEICSATTGALFAFETPEDGATAEIGARVDVLDAAPCGATEVSAERCSGKDKIARIGTLSPSASMASRVATDTNTYPGASSEPTSKGRAGFPSTAISAAPKPTLLAMTPDKTNLSAGPGPATVGGVAPRSLDKDIGLDKSSMIAVRGTTEPGSLLAVITDCVQYQPEITTNAHTRTVAVRQPGEFFSLNIEKPSSHSQAFACKTLYGIASSCPTTRRSYRRNIHGFTLIELMVVLVIIGVLAALIVPNVLDRADDARVMAARTDVNNLTQALKLYKLDNQRLPSTEQGLQALIVKPSAAPVPANWKAYLDKLPNDPWGRPYQYLNPGVKGEVDVMSLGADGQPGGEGKNADVGSWQ